MTQDQRNKKAKQLRLAAQIIETGCGWEAWSSISGKWFAPFNKDIEVAMKEGYEIRIKEPVIPVPEGWRELRDDEKDGGFVQGARYLSDGSKEWCSLTSGCYAHKPQRIIVPVSKPRVPLGPEDVPPGTCIKPSDEYVGWGLICEVDSSGVHLGEGRHLSFSNLMANNWSIKRPTDTEWQPCYKEVEPCLQQTAKL